MVVGVLGVQGGFAKHKEMIDSMGYKNMIVRTPEELYKTDALIIPGGESTTFLNLFEKLNLKDAILDYNKNSPIMGTCAGLIVLSKSVKNLKFKPLNLIDVEVDRNAYGRQKDSFIENIKVNLNNEQKNFEAVFIRAPKIIKHGQDCRVLANRNEEIIMVENDSILVCTFHPELTGNTIIHKYFLEKFIK